MEELWDEKIFFVVYCIIRNRYVESCESECDGIRFLCHER